jgi:signal transduction histidine kinase
MGAPLRVLIVEDCEDDAELLIRELRAGGYDVDHQRVDTAEALTEALGAREWDLVLADYTMPNFSGTRALSIVRGSGLDVPFIFISGTIGEDRAVEAMKAGAQDYLIKGNIKRLVPAIERELREARTRRERAQIELQLQHAHKLEAIGQLTGGIAHDFNNFLLVIIGNLDLLEGRLATDPEAQKLAEQALAASLRGAELTRQLLAFARQQPLEPRVFDLNQFVAGTVELLRRTIGEEIEIETTLAADLAAVKADPAQVESALANLAINARDAMPDGGKIMIETSKVRLDAAYAAEHPDVAPGDFVMLSVSDTGTGMPEWILARACEPFFTTKSREKGTGLGLSMVYGFAKQSGGHLKISTDVGKGTTVRLFLPYAEIQTMTDETPLVPEEAMHEPAATILVVEDNLDVRSVIVKQLAELGLQVIEADNAKIALAIIENGPPIDLLFTDVVMPGGMSGTELAQATKKARPEIKILLSSGFTGVNGESNGFAGEQMEFLKKPYRKHDLARKIRKMLQQPQPARRAGLRLVVDPPQH